MAADGSIIINTQLDDKQAQTQLNRLTKKIDSLNEKINTSQQQKMPLVAQAEKLGETLDAAKYKLDNMKTAGGFSKSQIAEQAETVRAFQTQWNSVQSQIDRYDSTIQKSTSELNRAKEEAGGLQQKLALSAKNTQDIASNAQVSNQKIVSLSAELSQLKARQAELSKSGVGLGHTEYDSIASRITEINKELSEYKRKLNNINKKTSATASLTQRIADAFKNANKHSGKLSNRIFGLVKRVFFFSVITTALRGVREWFVNVIKTNDETIQAIARLKGAFLTLAQPLIEIIIPALTTFLNILTMIISQIAGVVSTLFGKTKEESKEAAENLYEEANAVKETGKEAEEASKSMASFDEINQLTNNKKGKSKKDKKDEEIKPDFSEVEKGWLEDILDKVGEWVAIALLLGGIALIAIGAATGNLGLVLAGLLLLSAGVSVGEETGILESWADALGLDSVQEFIILAVLLAGIALVAIGAAMVNIAMVVAGLLLIWGAITYAEKNGMLEDWAEKLGLAKAAQYIVAALLIAGFALIVIGAIMGNILMVIAGIALIIAGFYVGMKSGVLEDWAKKLNLESAYELVTAALLIGGMVLIVFGAILGNVLMAVVGIGMLAAGIVIGTKTGTLKKWADALGLDSVFDYITAALQLAGICFIVFGAILGNLLMVIAGAVLLSVGSIAQIAGEETVMNWWETLKLTNVQQWVSVALLLLGIALVAIGAILTNVTLLVAGILLLGVGIVVSFQNDNLGSWVETLELEKVAGYATVALLLLGMALLVFGILLHNIIMIIASISLLAASVTIGVTSANGTSKSWVEVLHLEEVTRWVSTALQLAGVALIGIGAVTMNPLLIIAGLALLGVSLAAGTLSNKTSRGSFNGNGGGFGGGRMSSAYAAPSMASYHIPALATGAVIPPNREFLAVLGDQKSGTNIEAPTSEIEAAVARGIRSSNLTGSGNMTLVLDGDLAALARIFRPYLLVEGRKVGVSLVTDESIL